MGSLPHPVVSPIAFFYMSDNQSYLECCRVYNWGCCCDPQVFVSSRPAVAVDTMWGDLQIERHKGIQHRFVVTLHSIPSYSLNRTHPCSFSRSQLNRRSHDGLTFIVTLPNEKTALGHSQLKHKEYRDSLEVGDIVTVEMTPFDFGKARIIPTPSA